MGLPIMISHSESEKNNQASTNVPALPGAPTTGYVLTKLRNNQISY